MNGEQTIAAYPKTHTWTSDGELIETIAEGMRKRQIVLLGKNGEERQLHCFDFLIPVVIRKNLMSNAQKYNSLLPERTYLMEK